MESTEKSVGNENESFRKCSYPYCRNMALATTDYCEMHKHSSLLVKHPGKKNLGKEKLPSTTFNCPYTKCDYATDTQRGFNTHIGLVHKAELKAKKKQHAPDPPTRSALIVTITLTANEALETGIALALANKIDETRFANSHEISDKVLQALVDQIARENHQGAS